MDMKKPTPPPSTGYSDGVWGADGKTYCGPRNCRGCRPGSLSSSAAASGVAAAGAAAGVAPALILLVVAWLSLVICSWTSGTSNMADALGLVNQDAILHVDNIMMMLICWEFGAATIGTCIGTALGFDGTCQSSPSPSSSSSSSSSVV